jgi:penicillin-binding protein A
VIPESKQPRRRRQRPKLAPLLFALAILLGLLYLAAGLPLRHARAAWRAGHPLQAMAELQSWRGLHVRPREYDQMMAVALLSARRSQEARPYLDRLSGRPREWFPVVPKDEVARNLVSAGLYQSFLDYDNSQHERRESKSAPLYRAAALAGTGRIAEAEAQLARVDAGSVEKAKYDSVRSAIDQRKRGNYALVFDRAGGAIANYQVANRDLVAVNADFDSLIEKEAGPLTIESGLSAVGTDNSIETTLDPAIQKAALAALEGYRGSLVAIDPRSNEILAIASTRGRGSMENLALQAQYEPGSIIKVLTAANAFDSGLDFAKFFPLKCAGFFLVDGRQFRDWAAHGNLRTLDEALAVSCNVAFAQIGLALGVDKLRQVMSVAGFDSSVSLGLFSVPLGKTVGQIFNHFETCSYAVGLEHESVNTLHLAILASMMANRGVMTTPKLVTARRSILGDEIPMAAQQRKATVMSTAAANRMIQAMKAVVTDPRGTGRRAAVDGLEIAMKTGTAGQQSQGYQAVIMAFAPVDSPRIAIGMIAESAGPAEFAGAKIAHDFFAAVKERIGK